MIRINFLNKYLFLLFIFLASPQFVQANEWLNFRTPEWSQLTFEYTPEQINFLKQLPRSKEKMTVESMNQINKEASYQVQIAKPSGIDINLIPPYLANAQKDFAWISYLLTGEFTGNLGPVTLWTLQLFIPEASLSSVSEQDFDVMTSSIASLVVKKAAERLIAERNQIRDYPIKETADSWHPTSDGYRGIEYGSAKPWFLKSSDEFVADKPEEGEDYWSEQCDIVQKEQKHLDGKKVEAVYQWAGLTGVNAGSWEAILDDYLKEKHATLASQLLIRSFFQSALFDSTISAFNSKYTYWVMRPSQMNSNINPMITIPNHPSYPSAHSTNSFTAVTVLDELFPEDSKKWHHLAEEAGMSRIWGGIHYPCDHESGKKLGTEVGEAALQRGLPEKSRYRKATQTIRRERFQRR